MGFCCAATLNVVAFRPSSAWWFSAFSYIRASFESLCWWLALGVQASSQNVLLSYGALGIYTLYMTECRGRVERELGLLRRIE